MAKSNGTISVETLRALVGLAVAIVSVVTYAHVQFVTIERFKQQKADLHSELVEIKQTMSRIEARLWTIKFSPKKEFLHGGD